LNANVNLVLGWVGNGVAAKVDCRAVVCVGCVNLSVLLVPKAKPLLFHDNIAQGIAKGMVLVHQHKGARVRVIKGTGDDVHDRSVSRREWEASGDLGGLNHGHCEGLLAWLVVLCCLLACLLGIALMSH
jgi:hypothetical protein